VNTISGPLKERWTSEQSPAQNRLNQEFLLSMSTVDVFALKSVPAHAGSAATRLPLQETSLDIWDKKYRLKTKDGNNVD